MREEEKRISLVIKVDTLNRLDKLAKKGDISRAKLINNILELNVNGLERCGRIGILQTSLLIRDLGHNVLDWAKKTGGKDKKLNDYQDYIDKSE